MGKWVVEMKEYQGEKAIISLTSWKARINTVGLTIFSLLTSCPGFHVVLVLSEEEFPMKEAELPRDLQLLSRLNKIEILWVYKNYKAFKKVFFTMQKYASVPIISADDDLVYVDDYATLLYEKWLSIPSSCIGLSSSTCETIGDYTNAGLWGYAQLFPPNFFAHIDEHFIDTIVEMGCIDDDGLYMQIRQKYSVNAFSFQLPFNNKYIVNNVLADQFTCITKARKTHALHDKDIYWELLS